MRIEKEYRHLEGIDEVRIFNAEKKDFYKPTPKEFSVEDIPVQKLINNIPVEIHTLIPYDSGKDFIINGIGNFTLERYGKTQKDAKGRLLSKISPLYFNILYDYLFDVYTSHNTKNIRFVYYNNNKVTKVNTAKIIYDAERIFITVHNVDATVSKRIDTNYRTFDEDKTNLMESFSQTGSYYTLHGKYTWSQGIYNIINRAKEEADEYYNIVFDLAIPEDKHIVDKIFNITNKETAQCEEIIRIKTNDGILKVIEVNIYSYFDESGFIIRQGLINDITMYSDDELTKPVDFLLKGFKNSKKIALLIEPLNRKQYEYSKGFYDIIETDRETYYNSPGIITNIIEKDSAKMLKNLIDRKSTKIDETFTYAVNGNPNNKKILNLYIESFEYNESRHSLGFLTDMTDDMKKQDELVESNEQKLILIKEIHHRVKNNLQVLNSFLNLEKKAYKNDPELIIEHMQTRLNSLALLHEKTYRARDFKNINLKEYLIDHDRQTKNLVDLPVEVEFETYVDEDLNLSVEVMTPLLLIIDELTMNSVKHAFPDKTAPNKKITKEIKKLDNNTAQLIVKDNGVGIKDTSKITKNLGCEIIKSLSRQLGGKISLIETNNGTSYKLIFPIEMTHTI
ncbi:MAG: hypothetical protein IJL02_04505 [Methanobrevibacter sp.]|uniref:histidine kinase dimerization/phosphoacceptor domain -containing protein n=1 Tax=Methanobrevibacter sp. TaxID=66852 RepID=UPI0025EA2E61|nr:histidine kinase dimerization/phosphoacceptor domain -containing protein [Methanobrevibacter sp.]MBQ6099107.1 hypothetical protein [Methanobrevibacter sp.]